MSNQKPSPLVPALIGGLAAGILSGVPFFSCLCCIWIIGGAMLAAYLLVKDSPVILTAGDGAIVGIFTGIVAAVADSLISLPLRTLNREFVQRIMERIAEYTEEMPAGWETWMEGGASPGLFMLGLVASVIIFSALGALGGIIGISLFGKKTRIQSQGASDVPENTGDR